MGTTRIVAVKTGDEADEKVGFWQGLGFTIARIGPTDRIELDNGSAPDLLWDSGEAQDWILIVATRDGIVTG